MSVDLQQGQVCPSGMLAKFVDTARVLEGEVAIGIYWGEVKDAIKHLTRHRTAKNI